MNSINRKRIISKSTNPTKKNDYTWIWILIIVIVMMLLLGTCWCNGNANDTFANTISSGFKNTISKLGISSGNPAIKELDILYFMSPKCPWCQKMSDLLNKEGVMNDLTVIDVTTESGQKLAKDMGAASKGIPAFISKKNKTGTVGYKKSIDELINSLSQKTPEQSTEPATDDVLQTINNLQIVVFVSPSCGWCGKMKKELSDSGCMDIVELVDVSTPEGQQLAKDLLSEMRGVPACYSRATGKQTSGYKPIIKIIEELM